MADWTKQQELIFERVKELIEITPGAGIKSYNKDKDYLVKHFTNAVVLKKEDIFQDVVERWASEIKDCGYGSHKKDFNNPMALLTHMLKNEIPLNTNNLARLEGNIVEYPTYRLGKARINKPLIYEGERKYHEAGIIKKIRWEARTTSLIPNEEDADVYKALLKIYFDEGMPDSREIYFTYYQICTMLNKDISGKSYDQIKNAINYYSDLRITSDEAFLKFKENIFLNNKIDTIEKITLIEYAQLFHIKKQKILPGEELFKSYVRLSKEITDNMKAYYTSEIDWNFYISLVYPISKRIYELLSKRRGKDKKEELSLNIINFAQKIGMSVSVPRNIKRNMAGAISELTKCKFIKNHMIYLNEKKEEIIKFYF
jgi:hypothetical protein